MTDIKEIQTVKDYEQILKRIEEIFDSKPNTPEGGELKYLVGLVEKYENENLSTKSDFHVNTFSCELYTSRQCTNH